jgi:uncharacterized protein YecE (DUF72 family)
MNLYVGTSGYSYPAWKGSFYPKGLPRDGMLRYYGEQFRTVESNYTHRVIPKASVVEGWAGDVAADFRFALKAPQQITHFKRLKDAGDVLASFLDVAGMLKKRLGPILFQLPANFKKDVLRLKTFLALLPSKTRAAFEFRNATWFDDEVFDLMRRRRVALCIAEADADLDVPFVATANWGYLRLRMPEYSDAELKGWIKRVKKQAWSDAYVFFKHEYEARGPKMAARFLELAS